MIKQYRTELKNLKRKHGAKKIAKLFPTEKAYVDTADNIVKELCDGNINYFYAIMDSFVKDALVRTNLVEFCED